MPFRFNPFTDRLDVVDTTAIPPGTVQTLTGNSGGAVGPDGSGNINFTGQTLYTVAGNPGTNTLNINPRVNAYPITPYVVGPVGAAGYQTIQSAINAASAAGGGMVFVQKGTYTENLVFPDAIQLFGDSEQGTIIVGTHTPPSSGTLNIFRCTLQGTTAILSSAAAGTTAIIVEDCTINVTNGFAFDLLNWTAAGSVAVDDIGPFGTNDGFVRNTGGMGFYAFGAGVGNGSLNTMILSGPVQFLASSFACPINFQTGSSFTADACFFTNTVTFSNNSTGLLANCRISTGSSPAITMSSSASIQLTSSIVDSTNNPAITGAGAGTFGYSDVIFLNNSSFAGTLTTQALNWQPYGTAGTSVTAIKGTVGFNSAQFNVTSGFVSLNTAITETWIDQSSNTTLTANTNYFATAAVTLSLPLAPNQGNTVKVIADTASSVVLQAQGGQTIRLGNTTSSAGGTMTNSARGDSVYLVFRAADSTWLAETFTGVWVGA